MMLQFIGKSVAFSNKTF